MVDLDEKLTEFRKVLTKYDGVIPAQNVDRTANTAITYCMKKYGDSQQMQQLLAEFPNIRVPRHATFDEKLSKVVSYLQEYGKVPSISDDQAKYCYIRNIFQKYKDRDDVQRLRFVYAYGTDYPLKNTKYGPRPEAYYNSSDGGYVSLAYSRWKKNVAFEYIIFVYEKYGVFPAPNTRPMQELTKTIRLFYRYSSRFDKNEKQSLVDFIDQMVSLGCNNSIITSVYNVIHSGTIPHVEIDYIDFDDSMEVDND